MSMLSVLPIPKFVTKGWGYEEILFSFDDYCCKRLHFHNNGKGSFHFHKHKHETWIIQSGQIELTYTDPKNGHVIIRTCYPGEMIDIPQLATHQVYAAESAIILEVSTADFHYDNYRIAPGDSQR